MPWSCHIDLLTGPRAGQRLSFDLRAVPRITLGTDALAQVSFDREDYPQVERRHAVLSANAERDSLTLADSSREGTLLHGKAIRSKTVDGPTEVQLGPQGPVVRIVPERISQRPEVMTAPAPIEPDAPSNPGPPRSLRVPMMFAVIVIVVFLAYSWWQPPRDTARDDAAMQSRLKQAQEDMQRDIAARMARMDEELRKTKQQVNGSLMDVDASVMAARAKADDAAQKAGRAKGDAETFAEVARKCERAVGLVTGSGGQATAFAVGPQVFATNSHVSKPVAEALNKGDSCWIVLNKGSGKRLRIARALVHPQYDEHSQKPGIGHDVGLLFIDGRVDTWLPVASDAVLAQLDAGSSICYIGFPSEGLSGGNLDQDDPIATMKRGILTAVSDWELRDSGPQRNQLLRHDMGSAGGASGSPIIDSEGRAVGIHNAGNYFFLKDAPRIPNAANINFAQRIDCLKDIWPEYPKP